MLLLLQQVMGISGVHYVSMGAVALYCRCCGGHGSLYAVVSDAVAVGAVVFVLLMIVPLLAGSAVAACAVSYMVK